MLIAETQVPQRSRRFTFAADNRKQLQSERHRLRVDHLPIHVWQWDENATPPVLLDEYDL